MLFPDRPEVAFQVAHLPEGGCDFPAGPRAVLLREIERAGLLQHGVKEQLRHLPVCRWERASSPFRRGRYPRRLTPRNRSGTVNTELGHGPRERRYDPREGRYVPQEGR
jgi:hypothetical protein